MLRRASFSPRAGSFPFVFAILLPLTSAAVHFDSPTISADAPLDPPSVTVFGVDRTSVRLVVAAGSSGTPAGFVVEWIRRKDYDALGGWPADANNPALVRSRFIGTPTLTVSPGVPDYALGADRAILVEIGDLLDETGIDTDQIEELNWYTEFLFRAYALPSTKRPRSECSAAVVSKTQQGGNDCLFSQGYWKNHPENWLASFVKLGTVTYTASEALAILHEPARGNGLVFLAHQLIATKLNLGAGADPTAIQATVEAADALIGNLVVPPIGNGHVEPRDASDITEELDAYNNGQLGIECNGVAAEAVTWGQIKKRYR